MKKQFIFAALFFAATTMFVSCGDKEDIGVSDDDSTEGTTVLSGEISEDLTLSANTSYSLDGALVVNEGATLYIEEGVKITAVYDDLEDYILIKQGAKINAQGTASDPIVMTSESQVAGAWGGIHICGYATTNLSTTGVSEIGNAPYGGDDDTDNSGTLRYIRLEYTGFAFDEETESNGVTFYGVGNGTTVEYLQAYRGADDGFEFFGGTVNVKYLIATSCSDDAFDWTEGWRGKGQFLIAYHEAENELGYVCDCLLEADNNGDDNSASPMSHPVLSNLTLVGNNSSTKTDGVMLKAGTQVELYNTIITGKTYPIYTKTSVTEDALVSGASILDYITMTGEVYAAVGTYSNDAFIASENNSTDYVNELTNNYYGTVAGGSTPSDSFFTSADYKGAISTDNDWAAGWSL